MWTGPRPPTAGGPGTPYQSQGPQGPPPAGQPSQGPGSQYQSQGPLGPPPLGQPSQGPGSHYQSQGLQGPLPPGQPSQGPGSQYQSQGPQGPLPPRQPPPQGPGSPYQSQGPHGTSQRPGSMYPGPGPVGSDVYVPATAERVIERQHHHHGPPSGLAAGFTDDHRISPQVEINVVRLLDMRRQYMYGHPMNYRLRVIDESEHEVGRTNEIGETQKRPGAKGQPGMAPGVDDVETIDVGPVGVLKVNSPSKLLYVQVEYANGQVIGRCHLHRLDPRSESVWPYLLSDRDGNPVNCGIEVRLVEGRRPPPGSIPSHHSSHGHHGTGHSHGDLYGHHKGPYHSGMQQHRDDMGVDQHSVLEGLPFPVKEHHPYGALPDGRLFGYPGKVDTAPYPQHQPVQHEAHRVIVGAPLPGPPQPALLGYAAMLGPRPPLALGWSAPVVPRERSGLSLPRPPPSTQRSSW